MKRVNVFERPAFSENAERRLAVAEILKRVSEGGDAALREYGQRFGDYESADAEILLGPETMREAFDELDAKLRESLVSVAERVRKTGEGISASLARVESPYPYLRFEFRPVDHAVCYAPGGRYPLPSSVVMTAATAKAAGVAEISVMSPNNSAVMLAAAHAAGATRFIVAGGAQGIAAAAHGTESIPKADAIVGPGNAWVTEAKRQCFGLCRIDMPAGPSELAAIADESCNPASVAADLLAQAEHDPEAGVYLLATNEKVAEAVEAEVQKQLEVLPTREIAAQSCAKGQVVISNDLETACAAINALAPEHLALDVREPKPWCKKLKHYGARFVGESAAEVFGDYGAGLNHVLPTGGAAKAFGGLSVLDFLRVQAEQHSEAALPAGVIEDAIRLAEVEGLVAHQRAAERRKG